MEIYHIQDWKLDGNVHGWFKTEKPELEVFFRVDISKDEKYFLVDWGDNSAEEEIEIIKPGLGDSIKFTHVYRAPGLWCLTIRNVTGSRVSAGDQHWEQPCEWLRQIELCKYSPPPKGDAEALNLLHNRSNVAAILLV